MANTKKKNDLNENITSESVDFVIRFIRFTKIKKLVQKLKQRKVTKEKPVAGMF